MGGVPGTAGAQRHHTAEWTQRAPHVAEEQPEELSSSLGRPEAGKLMCVNKKPRALWEVATEDREGVGRTEARAGVNFHFGDQDVPMSEQPPSFRIVRRPGCMMQLLF